jgi:hypothetical protein
MVGTMNIGCVCFHFFNCQNDAEWCVHLFGHRGNPNSVIVVEHSQGEGFGVWEGILKSIIFVVFLQSVNQVEDHKGAVTLTGAHQRTSAPLHLRTSALAHQRTSAPTLQRHRNAHHCAHLVTAALIDRAPLLEMVRWATWTSDVFIATFSTNVNDGEWCAHSFRHCGHLKSLIVAKHSQSEGFGACWFHLDSFVLNMFLQSAHFVAAHQRVALTMGVSLLEMVRWAPSTLHVFTSTFKTKSKRFTMMCW